MRDVFWEGRGKARPELDGQRVWALKTLRTASTMTFFGFWLVDKHDCRRGNKVGTQMGIAENEEVAIYGKHSERVGESGK